MPIGVCDQRVASRIQYRLMRAQLPDRSPVSSIRSPAPLLAAMVLCCVASAAAAADEPASESGFIVRDVRIVGLQRISEGTIFNYLPVNIGDRLDVHRVQEALRALYATGFFRDVELRRDDGTLVIAVRERPSIGRFTISGNKDIETEDLERSLRSAGLAAGKVFQPSVLDEVEQALTEQYYSRGKYGVRIETTIDEQPGNKVDVSIEISEGERSRVRHINVVGNDAYSDRQILDSFTLKTANWLSWFRQDDRYAQESLRSDLETLRSFYMDRGYADFDILSTQVTISPDRKDLFVTINIAEGDRYTFSDITVAGTEVVPLEELQGLVLAASGQTFNQRLLTRSSELIGYRLGTEGYAFCRVDPIPKLDRVAKQVEVTFFVDPGSRVYVRRINFLGASGINDEVLRREMRQMEAAFLNNAAVDRSKGRLQRLPFIEQVEVETNPVSGTADLVDVDFTIEEGLAGQFGGGLGYSESQNVILNGSFVHSNFLGTGQRIGLNLNTSEYATIYQASHTDPYLDMDGLSRTVDLSFRDITQLTSSASDLSTEVWSMATEYSYPTSEYQRVSFGAALNSVELATTSVGSTQLRDWIRTNGEFRLEDLGTIAGLVTAFDVAELSAQWSFDTRNRFLFATDGGVHRFKLGATVPGSDVEYFSASYDFRQIFRIPAPWLRSLPFSFSGRLAYADALGDTSAVPPYRHFFAGGAESVRGFEESTLGPRDSLGNPYGGDLFVGAQLELLLPLPQKYASSARPVLFFDAGQVFYEGDVEFTDRNGDEVDYGFEFNEIRTSVGIGVEWLSPLGLFRFSYAFPLNYRRASDDRHGDDISRFQFSVGSAF